MRIALAIACIWASAAIFICIANRAFCIASHEHEHHHEAGQ